MNLFKHYFNIIKEKFIISETDTNGIITYVNENFEKISKYSKDELIGKPHSIIKHPENNKKIFERMWETIKNGKIWEGIIKNKTKDNKTYYQKSIIAPIIENGEIIKYVSISQDVTKLMHLKNTLAREKTLLQKTLDNTNNIILIRKNYEPYLANKQFFKILPFKSLKEFKEKHNGIHELFIKKDGYFYTDDPTWDEKYKNQTLKVVIKDKEGNERIFNMYISFFKLKKEKYSIITLSDITEIEKAKQKAEEAKQIKSKFLANISHEMRNPLNSIIGYIELLKYTNLSQEQKDFLEKIKFSSDTLMEIINSILDFSKIESNKLEIVPIKSNLYYLVISVYNTFKPIAMKKNIDLILDINYKEVKECYVFDPLRLKQVLINLVSNAIKFTEKGFVKIVVDKKDGKIVFKVIDSGIGIEKDKLNKIFEAYLQADKTTSLKYGGTGLGLNISYNLVKLMNSELKVKSEVNKGSEFYFSLELEECNSHLLKNKIESIKLLNPNLKDFFTTLGIKLNGEIEVYEDNPWDAYFKLYTLNENKDYHPTFENKKVLVVEDYELNAILLKTILDKLGIKSKILKEGKKALNEIKKENYDLVLLDITLPDISGIDVAKEIKKEKNIPIVAITGHISEDVQKNFKNHIDDYLIKPIEHQKFMNILKKYLLKTSPIEKVKNKFSLSTNESKEIWQLFIKNTKETLKKLKKAIEEKNFEEIYLHSHNLKSSAGYFELKEISELAKNIMQKADKKEEYDYFEKFKLIEKLFKEIS